MVAPVGYINQLHSQTALTLLCSAIKNAVNLAIGFFCIPATLGVGLGGDVDWLGGFLGVSGLILFNLAFK